MDQHQLKSELTQCAHLMESKGADFKENTWEFTAPYFTVGYGEYLIISVRDWNDIWEKVGA